MRCEECGGDGALRQCTGEVLCAPCRRLPERQILTERQLRQKAPQLPSECYPAPSGWLVNPVRASFPRQRVYSWAEVAKRCVSLGLPLP
jgi:hypothetical protein